MAARCGGDSRGRRKAWLAADDNARNVLLLACAAATKLASSSSRARVWRMRPELLKGKFTIFRIELCLTPHIATALQLCSQIEQMLLYCHKFDHTRMREFKNKN